VDAGAEREAGLRDELFRARAYNADLNRFNDDLQARIAEHEGRIRDVMADNATLMARVAAQERNHQANMRHNERTARDIQVLEQDLHFARSGRLQRMPAPGRR
jgi:hypothetical protein